jgi:hypothetical protein
VYALLAMVLTGATAFAVASRSGRSRGSEDREELRSLVERTVPGMCAMHGRLAAKDRAGASNVFWDEVHSGAHILVADLTAKKSTSLEPFLRSMTRVEEDLRTLAPTLGEAATAFSAQLHVALDVYDPAMWKPC